MSNPKERLTKMTDPLKPEITLLVKLGSVVTHVQEMLSAAGHPYDRIALGELLKDQEVIAWLKQMDAMALIPVKR